MDEYPPAPAVAPAKATSPGGPSVAVVIPTYNYAQFLARALGSVYRQTVSAAEIIVVDDGSDDDPAAVLADHPGVRLIRQRHLGLAAARNAGWRAAASEFVVFLDADDRLRPDALRLNLDQFRARPECSLAYGAYSRVNAATGWSTTVAVRPTGEDPVGSLLRGNIIGMHGAVMYRRSLLEELGGFDVSLPACEDYDLYLRAALALPISCRSEVLADYIRHDRNMSLDFPTMLESALAVLRRYRPVARRRPEWLAALCEGEAQLIDNAIVDWFYALRRAEDPLEARQLRRYGRRIAQLAPLSFARVVAGLGLAALLRRARRRGLGQATIGKWN